MQEVDGGHPFSLKHRGGAGGGLPAGIAFWTGRGGTPRRFVDGLENGAGPAGPARRMAGRQASVQIQIFPVRRKMLWPASKFLTQCPQARLE